jgi:hypothetical protein
MNEFWSKKEQLRNKPPISSSHTEGKKKCRQRGHQNKSPPKNFVPRATLQLRCDKQSSLSHFFSLSLSSDIFFGGRAKTGNGRIFSFDHFYSAKKRVPLKQQ